MTHACPWAICTHTTHIHQSHFPISQSVAMYPELALLGVTGRTLTWSGREEGKELNMYLPATVHT